MITLKQFFAAVAFTCLIAVASFAQTSVQNFGTDTGSYITANSSSTSFLPNPTGSGSTYVALNNGGGAINLVNPGLTNLGTNTEVRASASSNANVNKFTPILGYTASNSVYATFYVTLGNSTGGTNATSGEWACYLGTGSSFNSTGDIATSQVFAGLRFTFGTGGAITTHYLNGSTWTTLANDPIVQGNVYKIEIVGNNSNASINYNYGNTSRTLAVNRFDLWIDGVLIGSSLTKGALGNNTAFNSMTFIGKNSTSNVANIFVDDISIFNAIPSNISTSCTAPTIGSSALTFPSRTAGSINLSWTNGDGSNRIVVCRQGSAVSAVPSDNTSYAANAVYGSGAQISAGQFVVYNGSGSSVNVTGLPSGYEYYFKVFEYNCSNGNEKYNTTDVASGSEVTIPAAVTGFQNICEGNGTIKLTWNSPASGYDNVLIFARTLANSYNPAGNDGNTFVADSNFSLATTYGTDKCVYNGTGNSVTINGLNPGSTYYFRAYAYKGNAYSAATPIINAFAGVPNISGLALTPSSGTINASWTNPTSCFDEVMVVAVSINNVSLIPSGDGSDYFSDSFFGTDLANTNLPSNEYVVYKGNGTSATVVGLINTTNYKLKVFVRLGSYWSTGVQANATPTNVAGDYRSVASGNWSVASTWERFNGTSWVTSGAPNNTTTTVTIRAGHTITLDNTANGYSFQNLVVEEDAKLFVNSTTTQRFLNVFGQINNNGTIGNGNTKDGIAFNIEGTNVYIGGSGAYNISMLRKNANTNTTTNCSISADINFNIIGTNRTVIYNNQSSTVFNLTINAASVVSTPANYGNVSMDGPGGASGNNRRGSISVAGTLNVNGILYMTCKNNNGISSTATRINILSGGIINVDSINASSSSGSGHILTISNNGTLNIYGAGFYNFSTSGNTYTLNTGSLVEYSGTSAQTVEADIVYSNLKYSGGANNKTQNGDLTVNGNLVVDAAIYNVGTSSRNLNLGGNFTLQNGGSMNSVNCQSNLTIQCNNNNHQVFNGNGQTFHCYFFTSTKSSGSLSFNNGNSNLYSKDDMVLDYTGSAVFNDNGNTLTIGGALRFGSASSTSSNFNLTGTVLFNFDITTNGYSYICNVAQNGITVAHLNNITLQAISVATLPEVQIYPTSGGQTLTIKGNVTITNTNFNSILITNNNNIIVRGNWTTYNQSGFTEGTGRVTFNGTSNQTITGAETFYQLEINNPTSVILNNNIIVTNQLRLNNGVIVTGANEVQVTNNNAANAVVLHNINSYVQGKLRRNVASTGTYDFPVGNSNYQLATVKLNSSSGISNLIASFTDGLPTTMPDPTTCKVNGTGISTMLNNGYWTIHPNAVTSVNYDITLNGRGYTNFSGGATQLCVIKRANSSAPWLGTNSSGVNGYHSAANQSLSGGAAISKRTSLTSFSDFGIGFGAVPLPVELTTFNVIATAQQSSLIHWTTASELNCDYFEIQHSVNGTEFTTLGYVKGAGTSPFENHYSFMHNNPACGINYYRLRQVDFDGKFEYSDIKAISFVCPVEVTLYPNPTHQTLYLNIANADMPVYVSLYNIKGELISTANYTSAGIDVSQLVNGTYLLQIEQGSQFSTQKFVKE